MAIHKVFATPLYEADIAITEDARTAMMESLTWHKKTIGFQSQSDLHESDAWSGFAAQCLQHVVDFYGQLGHDSVEWFITQMWCNRMARGERIHDHFHSNSVVSAVYYLQAEGKQGGTIFKDPRPRPQLQVGHERPTEWTADELVIHAQQGRLVLFPSWMTHTSQPNTTSVDRYTVSFNAMPKTLGGEQGLNRLQIS